ncbi:leucine-rich repeat protein, partial [Klebsiella pneumoniae]|uniref:leucine-rich repeat protein n=1 Tax=Klebsiella pneumoniae TaxID=573 RepID=UPI0025A00ECE
WGGWTYYPAINPSPSGDYAIPDMLYDSATSNWYPVAEIGPMAALSATTLARLTFPNTVTFIDYESFRGAANLVEVAFPNSLKSIGNS